MTRPRWNYTGPVCPRGGELRLTFAKREGRGTFGNKAKHSNRVLRIWCTCMAQMDGPVHERQWNYDYLMEIDVSESHVPVWEAHCDNVAKGGNGHVELDFRH